MNNKIVLVTGGAGFIGSHLCERLVRDEPDSHIISLDNYFTGSPNNHVDGVEYIEGDTRLIEQHVQIAPDVIYHLGEYSRVEQSFEDIALVYDYNKLGTFAVLEFCRKCGSKIVYAGSSTKFGHHGIGRDGSPYAWAKASNTELVANYGEWYGLRYAVTYFYNVYGPREISTGKYATLIGLFAQKMEEKEPLTVVTPGTQVRNFTHVHDIVDGLILVGQYGFGDEFGIGDPKTYSVLEVANLFGGEVLMLPERRGNRMGAEVCTEKTKALGWMPKEALADYIATLKMKSGM